MASIKLGGLTIDVPDNVSVGGGGSTANNNAHISAQNAAGVEMGNIVNAYQSLVASGMNNVANVQALVVRMQQAVQVFANVVNAVGTSRARTGLSDITNLANQIMSGWQTTSGPLVGAVTGGGSISTAIGSIANDPASLALVAVGAYLLLKKR